MRPCSRPSKRSGCAATKRAGAEGRAGGLPGRDLVGRSHKTVVHAELGEIILDCDILTIERADLHIVLNWAAPNTGAAEKLAVLRERVAAAAR